MQPTFLILADRTDITRAVAHARQFDSRVLLESFHAGLDLRIVVIGYEVVAAAIRHPAQVLGEFDYQHPVFDLDALADAVRSGRIGAFTMDSDDERLHASDSPLREA